MRMSVWDVVAAIAEAFLGDSSQWANRRSAQRADRRGRGRTLSTSFDIPVSIEFQRASWFQRPDGSWLRWDAAANSWVAAPEGPPPEMAAMLSSASPPAPDATQLTLPVSPAGTEPTLPAETDASAGGPPPAATPAAPSPADAGALPPAHAAPALRPSELADAMPNPALADLRTRADLVKAVILEVGLDAREASGAVETVLRVLEEQRVERARRGPAARADPADERPPP
jgi:hypothetical protein